MALNIAQMDKVTGLSAGKMAAMDKVAASKPNAPQQQQPKPGDKSGDWTDWLPGILGTAGQIGGGALGAVGGGAAGIETGPGALLTGAVGEKLGQTAGGAVGQGAGEGIRQWINNLRGKTQGVDPGAIGSETAQGGLYGALPGSQFLRGAGSFAARALKAGATNMAGGSIVGGATQAVRNIQQGKPVGDDVPQQALATGAINTVLPTFSQGIPDGARSLAGIVLDKIPKNVKGQLDSLAAQMKQLEEEKLGHMVGHANIDRAKTNELGLTHTHTAKQASDVIEKEMQDVGGQLNETLGHETVGTNLANLKKAFMDARDQAFSGSNKNADKLNDFTERMDNFIKSQIQRIAQEKIEKAGGKDAAEAAAQAAGGQEMNTAQSAAEATKNSGTNGRTIFFDQGQKGAESVPNAASINGKDITPNVGESPSSFIQRLEKMTTPANKGPKFATDDKPPLKLGADLNKANDFKATSATGGMNRDESVDFANDQSPLSLLTANEIKTQLGKLAYAKNGDIADPVFAQAYHNLQKHIEDFSGNPEKIKGLNADYNQLRDMSHHAETEIKNPKMTNTDFDAKKRILENKTPRNQALDTMAAMAPIILGTTLGGPMGGAIGGGTFAAYRALSALLANQGVQRGAVNTATSFRNSAPVRALGKMAGPKVQNPLQRAIQQTGVQSTGN